MNERIEQLAERATKEMDQEAFSEDMNIPAEWYHKFAELIVQECLDVINQSNGVGDDDVIKISKDVEKHFGVEA